MYTNLQTETRLCWKRVNDVRSIDLFVRESETRNGAPHGTDENGRNSMSYLFSLFSKFLNRFSFVHYSCGRRASDRLVENRVNLVGKRVRCHPLPQGGVSTISAPSPCTSGEKIRNEKGRRGCNPSKKGWEVIKKVTCKRPLYKTPTQKDFG